MHQIRASSRLGRFPPWLLAAVVLCASRMAVAEVDPQRGITMFEERVLPLLKQHCYECHSHGAGQASGGLVLDSRAGWAVGGSSGPAIVPGKPDESLLMHAVSYGDDELQMPPEGKLDEASIELLREWIRLGAPDPRVASEAPPSDKPSEEHWAWRPPRRPDLPSVAHADWPRDRIDYFVLAKLEEADLRPAPDADRRTLIRRATLELTGLPSTPEEIAAFLHDPRSDREAFAAVVDRLLASPAFGPRWGRHWLDVARFAESSGFSRNMTYPLAWRYRNYVIDAFNDDKPFDQFVREQLAGDLLADAADSPQQHDEKIIATGFLTIGPKELNEGNLLQFDLNIADDQIDATCRAFLALTANCARCHDHKYDPIPARDYYALVGVFRSCRNLAGAETNVRNEHGGVHPLGPNGWERMQAVEEHGAKVEEAQKTYLEIVKKRNALREELEKAGVDWKTSPTPELEAAEAEIDKHQEIVQNLRDNPPPYPQAAMAVVDAESMVDSPLYQRGDASKPGETVARGVLTLFGYDAPLIGEKESGRLQLAEWIVDRRNPLTARVYVNRVWRWLFGAGLVETVDNFGVLGESPSHPDLLDDLALRLMDGGWSTKALIRDIMLSRTYMLASAHDDGAYAVDPGNRLHWRFAPQRLEGEAIRDSILFVSGRLDPSALEGSQAADISARQPKALQREIGRRNFYVNDITADVPVRTVYLPHARSALLDVVKTFDAADPNLIVGARQVTTTPAQALYLMNSRWVIEQSHAIAARALEQPDEQRIAFLYEQLLGRPPTASETQLVHDFLNGQPEQENWAQVCQALICSAEFRTIY